MGLHIDEIIKSLDTRGLVITKQDINSHSEIFEKELNQYLERNLSTTQIEKISKIRQACREVIVLCKGNRIQSAQISIKYCIAQQKTLNSDFEKILTMSFIESAIAYFESVIGKFSSAEARLRKCISNDNLLSNYYELHAMATHAYQSLHNIIRIKKILKQPLVAHSLAFECLCLLLGKNINSKYLEELSFENNKDLSFQLKEVFIIQILNEYIQISIGSIIGGTKKEFKTLEGLFRNSLLSCSIYCGDFFKIISKDDASWPEELAGDFITKGRYKNPLSILWEAVILKMLYILSKKDNCKQEIVKIIGIYKKLKAVSPTIHKQILIIEDSLHVNTYDQLWKSEHKF